MMYRKMIVGLTAMISLLALALAPMASASRDLSGKGTIVLRTLSFSDGVTDPDTGFTTYNVVGAGNFYGTISGPYTETGTITLSPTAGTPAGGPVVGSVIRTCDPCTVAGLTGSITFLVPANVANMTRSPVTVTMLIIGATGDLAGITGSGSYTTTAMAKVEGPYTITINLP